MDGVVIAVLLRANDVRQGRHDVNKLATMSDKLNKPTHDVRQPAHDVNKPRLSPWELKYGR